MTEPVINVTLVEDPAMPPPTFASVEAFRHWLLDFFLTETDHRRILAVTAEAVGKFLGVSSVAFGEIEAEGSVMHFPLDWSDGAPSLRGRHDFFPESAIAAAYNTGRTLVVDDVAALATVRDEAEQIDGFGIRAFVTVPLVANGACVAILTATSLGVRHWQPAEIALLEDTARRIRNALEHLRTAERVRASEEQFRSLAQTMPGICWFADPSGRLYWMNPSGIAYFGHAGEGFSGTFDAIHPDERTAAARRWTAALSRRTPLEMVTRFRGQDGLHRPFLCSAVPILDGAGALARWCGTMTDLSERHARERRDIVVRRFADRAREVHDPAAAVAALRRSLDTLFGPCNAEIVEGCVGETPGLGLAAEMQVPLLDGDRPVATLVIETVEPRLWTDEDLAACAAMLDRCWSALTRLKAEEELRDRDRQQAFLIEWADRIRSETVPQTILAVTVQMLGSHLGVDRLNFVERSDDGGRFTVAEQWARDGVTDADRVIPITALGERGAQDYLRREVVVRDDIEADTAMDAAARAHFRASGIAAFIAVPLVESDSVRAVLVAHQFVPRRWRTADVRLMRDVADRIWSIVERARVEQRLRESEALLNAFMTNAPIGMHLSDEDGRCIQANPQFAAALDQPLDAVIGRRPSELVPEFVADEFAALEQRAREGISAQSEIYLGTRPRYSSALAISFPIPGSHGVARTGGFTIDVSERRATEAALKQSREALYQTEKLSALGSMLAGVSHELNNPLSIVGAQAAILEKMVDGDARERVQKVRRASDRCARIVHTFLAMARQNRPERVAVDVSAVIDAALDLTEFGFRRENIVVRRPVTGMLPSISADADQLHQIVVNLLMNAQQAIVASGVSVRQVTVRTEHDAAADTVSIVVTDTGPGVPPALRRRIFEPFFTTKAQGEGTGVGLSFSQGLAEAHGGRLELLPEGPGASFRLTLPVGNLLADASSPDALADAARPARRALVIDDQEEIAETLADLLTMEGFVCDIAVGGAEGKRWLGAARYDLVISDLRMPDIDGMALFDWLVMTRPDLADRVAFATGDTLSPSVSNFLKRARRPVLDKPFLPEGVHRLLQQVKLA